MRDGTTAFTFISSSQAVQRLGAVAVPVDIDPDACNIDPVAAANAIPPHRGDHAGSPAATCPAAVPWST